MPAKKFIDSVRKRKKAEASAMQKFLPIAEIKQDSVVLKNGGIRAVLAVGSMNFSLKSEDEQQGIIVSYQQFLNTLAFPIQIVVRSTKINIAGYLHNLSDRVNSQMNPLLKEQTRDYMQFIERLVDVSDIMQKHFYIIIPVNPPGMKNISFLQNFFGLLSSGGDTREKALTRKRQFEGMAVQLRDRVNLVKAGIANVGCPAERLKTSELIELFYHVYNPKTGQEQKLPSMDQISVKEYIL